MNNQNNSSAPSDWINDVIRDVAELPDRDSPEDAPDMMLVNGDELREIIVARTPKMTSDRVQGGLTDEQIMEIHVELSAKAWAKGFDHPDPRDFARAILSRQCMMGGEARVDDPIRGPLTDTQRNECRALYNNLKHLPGIDTADDVIRKAAVYGYTNGRHDFAAPQEPVASRAWDAIALAVNEAEKQGLDYVTTDLLRKLLVKTRAAAHPLQEGTTAPATAAAANVDGLFDLNALADACIDAEISDSKYQSLCIALKDRASAADADGQKGDGIA